MTFFGTQCILIGVVPLADRLCQIVSDIDINVFFVNNNYSIINFPMTD